MPPGARNGEYIRFTDVSILLEPVTRYQHAQEIAHRVEEQYTGIDDFGDAMRHAEWSRQMTREIGLFRAWLYGTGHEMTGWFSQGNFEAMFMDLQNNSVGRSAGFYCQDVPVDDLVWIINAPPGHTPDYRDVNPAVIQPMLW